MHSQLDSGPKERVAVVLVPAQQLLHDGSHLCWRRVWVQEHHKGRHVSGVRLLCRLSPAVPSLFEQLPPRHPQRQLRVRVQPLPH